MVFLHPAASMAFPVEIVSRILAIFREGFPAGLDNCNVNLASRLLRTLHRKPKPLQLLTEERVRDFFTSAEQFHRVFAISMPQIAFCEVRCLELALPPPSSDAYPTMSRTLGHLSLFQLNLIMQGDSVDGAEFMALVPHWGPSLERLEVLRIKYKFWKSEDDDFEKSLSDAFCSTLWKMCLEALPALRVLHLDTPLLLTPDCASLELMTIKKWGSWCPTLCRIYLFQGYDEDYGVGDHLCLGRMGIYVRDSEGNWEDKAWEMGYPPTPWRARKEIAEDADPFAQ